MPAKATAQTPTKTKKGVSVNIDAFEIVPRGTKIVIESGTPLDDRAIGAGLRFDKTRKRPEITERGTRAVIAVDDSFRNGRNTLYLNDLYTPQNEAMDVDLEIPFFVVDSQVPFPKDVKVESYSRVTLEGNRIRRTAPGESPSFELMKGTQRSDGKPWEGAYDKAGNQVDFNRVRAEIMKARQDRYGKLEPRLHDRISTGTSGPQSVAVWLREKAPAKAKSERQETRRRPAAEEEVRKANQERASRFMQTYKVADLGKNVRMDQTAPVIYAELDPESIRRLAELPEVSMIFVYEPKGIDDLGNSIGIAQSDNAHALGYNGSNVKVAVYEQGPDDTSNLTITARYKNNPATSQHSRHTHGIIRNNERNAPHGHAPDCSLHSANDYDLDAIRWAADQGCTVISQSFHRDEEQTNATLSFDDIYKDRLALHWPYPTICEAAGNGADTEFVNHKGYNRLTVANHNDTATGMAGDTVFRNPQTDHGDRELPEISANGTSVTAVGLTLGGTSMAAPAVAGSTACVQEVNSVLKSWPEGCRAIQLAAAKLNPDGGTWWSDVVAGDDGVDGTGAVNTLQAVRIAEQRKGRNNRAAPKGFDVGTLQTSDIGRNGETTFSYNISVPRTIFSSHYVKVALAWDSEVVDFNFFGISFPIASVLTLDLDLKIYDSAGNLVGYSGSWDNSYEIAEFRARPGETYTIKIRRWSGTNDVWYGIAWNTVSTPWIFDFSVEGVATRG
ncbi:MAG TPA: S8 family serine peptidase [Pyrinomonadaceae bacterium]